MIEEIMKHAPKGATHWQAGVYYRENDYGVWSIWDENEWHSSFRFPDGVMTPLVNEVSMFKVGDFLVYKDSSKYKDCLFKVIDDEDAVAIAVEDGKECFVYFADMRLATQEEIAAGHRIDKCPHGYDVALPTLWFWHCGWKAGLSRWFGSAGEVMISEFEKTRTFKSIYSTLMYFDEDLNIYASNNKLREEDAVRLTYAWWGYQERQTEVDELKKRVDSAHDTLTELKEKSEALHHRWQIFSDSVALAEAEMIDMCVKELEQALKGGES